MQSATISCITESWEVRQTPSNSQVYKVARAMGRQGSSAERHQARTDVGNVLATVRATLGRLSMRQNRTSCWLEKRPIWTA